MIMMTWTLDVLAIFLSLAAFFLDRNDVKDYKREDDLYKKICLLSVTLSVIKIAEDTITPGLDVESLGYESLIFGYFYDILDVILLLFWILFVDYIVYRSEDHLRCLKPYVIRILAAISAIETFLLLAAMFGSFVSDSAFDRMQYWAIAIWMVASYYVLKIVETVLLVISLTILVRYRKRRKGPVMFRGMTFYIPVFLGWVITIILNYEIDLNPIATGIGVFMLYFSMRYERRFIDSETGFFSREYLAILSEKGQKQKNEEGIGILVKSADSTNTFASVLRSIKPEEIDIIRVSKEAFFLVGEKKPNSTMEIFRQNLYENAEENGINMSVKYDFRRVGESPEELLERIIEN